MPKGVLDYLTGFAGLASGPISQAWANRENERLIDKRNALSLAQWNRENAYNNPINQMMRLKAAGLNPNLMYGQLSGQLGAAASPDMASAQVSSTGYRIDPLTAAQIRNLDAQTTSTNDANSRENERQPFSIEKLKADIANVDQQTHNLLSENDKILADTELSKMLSKKADADARSAFEDFRYKQSALSYRLSYISNLAYKEGLEGVKLNEELNYYGDMLKQQLDNLRRSYDLISSQIHEHEANAAFQNESRKYIGQRVAAETMNAEANYGRTMSDAYLGGMRIALRIEELNGQLERWSDMTVNERLSIAAGATDKIVDLGYDVYKGGKVKETVTDKKGNRTSTYTRFRNQKISNPPKIYRVFK